MRAAARRGLAATTGILWLGAVAGCNGEARELRHVDANLILISVDTLRADHLGAYGYERETSRVLDELAASSVLFERVYSQSPKTAPSHMTLMTSLHPSAHGVRNWRAGGTPTLAPGTPTLASTLRDSGYRCAAYTAGGNVSAQLGFDRGFEHYQENGRETLDDIMNWVDDARSEGPFFLFFHTYEVHDPYLPPQPYDRLFDPDYDGRIRYQRVHDGKSLHGAKYLHHEAFWDLVDREDPRDREHLVALYDGQIRFLDETLAPLLSELEARGLLEQSVLVVTSDHGEEFHDHGGFFHNNLHEEVLRVPLLLRLPEARLAGRRIKELARLVDLKPTLLDLLGVERSALALQGRSLLPLLEGVGFDGEQPAFAEWKSPKRDVLSVRTGQWKLIWNRKKDGMALYDVTRDPTERNDLVEQRPEVAERLRDQIERYEAEQLEWKAHGAAPGE